MCGATSPQVGGFEVLSAMERIATDDDDRPMEEVKITGEKGRKEITGIGRKEVQGCIQGGGRSRLRLRKGVQGGGRGQLGENSAFGRA